MEGHEIDRFLAVNDDGDKFTVVEYQETVGKAIGGRTGSKELRLSTGHYVSRIDAKTFRVNETGQLIRKIETY